MLTPTCSKCRRVISSDDINVAQDVAYCRDCNQSYSLADLTHSNATSVEVNLQHPPKGAWYISDASGTVIGAINRNLINGVGFLFFALFWNGIVSIFVFFAFISTLNHLHISLPAWCPEPKMEGGGELGVGMTIGLWIFLIPFICIGLFAVGGVLCSLLGRTDVRITGGRGTVFTGIGSLGWKRRFETAQVNNIQMRRKHNSEGSDTFTVMIQTREGREIKLGSLLTNERRQFILAALRKTILSL